MYRIHGCHCGEKWQAAVEYTTTPNLSGEKTPYCPKCGKRAAYSQPATAAELPPIAYVSEDTIIRLLTK